jgi:hypothetical protein
MTFLIQVDIFLRAAGHRSIIPLAYIRLCRFAVFRSQAVPAAAKKLVNVYIFPQSRPLPVLGFQIIILFLIF